MGAGLGANSNRGDHRIPDARVDCPLHRGCVIKCLLNRDGSVASAEPVSGPGLLKDQARRNAMLWRFRRASRKRTNNYSFTLTYRYKLEGDPEDGRHASFAVDLPGLVDIVAHLPPPMID